MYGVCGCAGVGVQIRDRYSFLHYILTNSPLCLDKARVDELWGLSYTDASTAQERENGFKWWKKACGVRGGSAKGFVVMEDDVTDYLYRKLMKEVDPVTLTRSGFECWERFFLYLNERSRKLEVKGEDFTVVDFSLDGMEYLWRVALESKRTQHVVPKAIALLNKLHEKLADALRPQIGAIRNRYIEVVMNQAKTVLAQEKKVTPLCFCCVCLCWRVAHPCAALRCAALHRWTAPRSPPKWSAASRSSPISWTRLRAKAPPVCARTARRRAANCSKSHSNTPTKNGASYPHLLPPSDGGLSDVMTHV
jgi:hypothetical protein